MRPDSHPPAPWYLSGDAWVGLFYTDAPVPLPVDLRRFGPSRLIVIALARYCAGTLGYDELAVGPLARRRLRIGLYVSHMWVNDLVSLRGGRHIWGLPKQLADFAWDGDRVRVTDAEGLVAGVRFGSRRGRTARRPYGIPVLAPAFGGLDGERTYVLGRLWARPAITGLRIDDWSSRFPYRPSPTPLAGIAARPFRMRVPPPVRFSP